MKAEGGGKPQAFAGGRNLWLLVLIVFVGLLLRVPTVKMGLWCDEMIALYVASQPSFSLLCTALSEAEGNPPFYHMILSVWVHAFGNGEIIVKIPSLLFGLLYIVATYVLGRKVYSAPVGLIAALCAALSPQANYFACQTRPHSLASLLICLSLFFYLKHFEKFSLTTLLTFVIIATASLYTSYLTLFLFVALAIVTAFLEFRGSIFGGEAKAPINMVRFGQCAVALLLPCLLFAPWWHVVLEQLHGAKPVTSAPISSWPLVFLFNLTTMIPVPLQVGVFLTPLAILAGLFVLLRRLSIKKLSSEEVRKSILGWVKTVKPDRAFLIGASFLPAAVIGIVTPFFLGYFRYIYPFSSGFWVLLGVLFVHLFSLNTPASNAEDKPKWQPTKVALAVLLVVSVIDLYYLLDFAKEPESGMRALAKDVLIGKYDRTAILVAPDHGAMTLDYYLPVSQCQAHDLFLCGFPRWHTAKPETSGLPAFYLADRVVEKAVDRIAELPALGFKRLLLVNDHAYDQVANAPIGERCRQLKDALSTRYASKPYGQSLGRTETSDLTMFQLEPSKPQ